MKEIKAYTDGSSVVKGKYKGYGGYGCYFPKNLYRKRVGYSKGFKDSKTGRMEVMALQKAITSFPLEYNEDILLHIVSDSEYIVKSFTENRLEKWENNNWISYSGEIKNRDLWEDILEQLRKRKYLNIKLTHIKSHQVDREKDKEKKKNLMKNEDILGNMIADKLANYKRIFKIN